jgi:hypothetical protein
MREALIARLVRQIAARCDRRDNPDDVLRLCMGTALQYDLSAEEMQWLVCGVEGQTDLPLDPMTKIVA